MNIWFSTGENAGLSNLAYRPFQDKEGREYRSVEHAYQSWKSGSFDASAYARGKTRRKAPGRKGTKTENDWNLALMERLVRRSFRANPQALRELLATGDAEFAHKQDKGIWKTQFPRILTMIRNELRD